MYTKALFGILVVLIIVIYVHYYTSYRTDYNILQTYLDNIDINLLYEKYPIVIYDQIKHPQELLRTLFAYSYMFKKEVTVSPHVPIINKSKYMILWCDITDIFVNIINPRYKKNNKVQG